MLYRSFANTEDINRQYNPMLGQDPQQVIGQYVEKSRSTSEALNPSHSVHFGPTRAEHLDIFQAEGEEAPVHIFLHGGYWRACSSKEFSFVARQLVPSGITTLVVNYALCPQVSMTEIVRQARASVAWAWRNAERLGANPNNITVSGHSAGGHLVGMLLATDWEDEYGIPADVIKGALAISGLFDLGPFPHSWLQPDLNLSAEEVERLSPINLKPVGRVPVRLRAGALESDEFHRQSESYRHHLSAQGLDADYQSVPDTDHYTVLDQLYQKDGVLVRDILEMSKRICTQEQGLQAVD